MILTSAASIPQFTLSYIALYGKKIGGKQIYIELMS